MTIGRHQLDRRSVLRGGVGGAAVTLGLPALEAMLGPHGDALAAGTPLPRRLGVFFWALGVRLKLWIPATEGAAYALSEELAPLGPYKDYLNVVTGMEVKSLGGVHHSGTVAMLSGTSPLERGGAVNTTFRQRSIDQVAAAAIGSGTRLRSLELGVIRDGILKAEGTTTRAISHNGPESPNLPEFDPAAAFTRLIGGEVRPGESALPLRRSVLDTVRADAVALRARVGAQDRRRLDEHLDGLRGIERRLEPTPGCMAKAPPAVAMNAAMPPWDDIARLQCDLITLALQCDLARAFSLGMSMPSSDPVLWNLGETRDHHTLSHQEPGEQPTINAGVLFYMKHLAYLLGRLKETPEGSGNLLDSTAVFGTSEVAEGKGHSTVNMPILVAGRGGGALRYPGVHFKANKESICKVHLSVLRAVGVPISEFGDARNRATEGCTAIEAA